MIIHGDCLEVMTTMDAESIDSIVTDPPYGLSFMGKNWDHGIPGVPFWSEALRVAKPGAHLLAFGGTRTFHRLTCAIEDAGWEIRDCVMWVYGSGFPKSHDVSKAIDKAAWAERKLGPKRVSVDGTVAHARAGARHEGYEIPWHSDAVAVDRNTRVSYPATPLAQQWQGWGTALKPAWEPIIVARKPPVGTVAANVLRHGTGAINVDGCRIGLNAEWSYPKGRRGKGWHGKDSLSKNLHDPMQSTAGRWPANLIHDGSDEVTGLMGSASRFFYCAKASKADRDEGCDGIEAIHRVNGNKWTDQDYRVTNGERPPSAESGPRRNHHPTVKPTGLMRYLCRLVTPPGGTVLDPFCGSGSTGKAATLEGFEFIGIEREAEYVAISQARLEHARSKSL